LAAPFAAAIIFVNRRRFRTVRPGPSWAGPLVVAAGWALAWYGFTDAHQSAWHMGAVLVALGAVVTVLGHDVLVKYWAAFLLLAFMVPVPNGVRLGIALPLQTAMATIVERTLSFFGEPVSRQHNQLLVNGVPVSIAEACNGLRMVFSLILVCWLFAFVTPLKNWARWMIILLSPVTALACNVIRLIPTVLFYGHGTKETAEKFHDFAGWPMVIIAFFLLMGVIALLSAFGLSVMGDDDDEGKGGGAKNGAEPTAVDVVGAV
jgi:exosortase